MSEKEEENMTTFNPENSAISDLVSFATQVKREASSKEGKVAAVQRAFFDQTQPPSFQAAKTTLLNIQNVLNQSDNANCDVELHRDVRELFHGEIYKALTDLTSSFEEIAKSFSGAEQKELSKIVEKIKTRALQVSEQVRGLEGFERVQKKITNIREKLDSAISIQDLAKVKKELVLATQELQRNIGPDEDFREHILAEDLEVLSLEILAHEVQLAFPSDNLLLTYEGQSKRVIAEVERIRKTYEVSPDESPQKEIAKLINKVQIFLDDELIQQLDKMGTLSETKDVSALLAQFKEKGEIFTTLVDKRPQFSDPKMTGRYLEHIGKRLDDLTQQFIVQFAAFSHPLQDEAKLFKEKPANLEHLRLLFENLKRVLSLQKPQERLKEADVKASLQLARGLLEALEKAQINQSTAYYEKKESAHAGKHSVVVLERVEKSVSTASSKMTEQASLVEKVFQNIAWTLPHVQIMLYDLAINYFMNSGVNAIDVTYALGYIALIGGALQISKRVPDQHKWLMPYVTWGLSLAYYFGKPYATTKLREAASIITEQATNFHKMPVKPSPGFGLSGVSHDELDTDRLLPPFQEPRFAGPLEPIPKVPQPMCPVPDPYDWGKPLPQPNTATMPTVAPSADVQGAAKANRSWFSFFWGK